MYLLFIWRGTWTNPLQGSLLRVCICYNVSSLFLSIPLITIIVLDKSGLACCLFCTKSGWRCICNFSLPLPFNLQSPPANRKQGPIPDAMSKTLLTNKKPGKLDYNYTPLTLLSQRKLALTARNILFAL
jgi:hypothetical protein